MPEEQKLNIFKEIIEWIVYFASAILIASLLQSQLFALTTVHQSSMQNTLFEGHMLIMNKIGYCFSKPEKGDIIVFVKNEDSSSFIKRYRIFMQDVRLRFKSKFRTNRLIKRVIAMPGDKVDIHDGQVYINDSLLEEPYVKGMTPGMDLKFPIVIPDGYVFVMGDNRENSMDSRSFGPVSMDSVEGKAMFRVYPFSQIGRP